MMPISKQVHKVSDSEIIRVGSEVRRRLTVMAVICRVGGGASPTLEEFCYCWDEPFDS